MAIGERAVESRNGDRATETRSSDRATAERSKAVDAAILSIEKQFGRGSIMKLGSRERQSVDVIPTGSIALDLALGVGGMPRGRDRQRSSGSESSGKTTLCQHILASAQQRGGVVAFIDVEHALDPGYARACGVNVDELLVSQPDTGEQALEITETLIRSGGIDCVVVDSSVAAPLCRAPRSKARWAICSSVSVRSADEPGAAQADGRRQPLEYGPRLHEPAAREDRRDVRQSGDDPGRPGTQVLCERPARHPARRDDQDRHGVGRQPGTRQGREEQGRAAVPARRVRHHATARASPAKAACSMSALLRHGRRDQDRGVVHAFVEHAASGQWSRGIRRTSCARTPRSRPRSSARSARRSRTCRSPSRASKRPSSHGGTRRRRLSPMNGGEARRRREERLTERAEITDPAVVLAAAARFLEARPRGTTETRRRFLHRRLPGRPGRRRDRATDRAGAPRRRGLRQGLDRIARSGAAAR